MKDDDAVLELQRLVAKYVDDEKAREELRQLIVLNGAFATKGVLAEITRAKGKRVTSDDVEIIHRLAVEFI
jgi:hypothetical protein